MKKSDAFKFAKENEEFFFRVQRQRKYLEEDPEYGIYTFLFSFEGNNCEVFYWTIEKFFDEGVQQYLIREEKGKLSSASRSMYLIESGKTNVLPAPKVTLKL